MTDMPGKREHSNNIERVKYTKQKKPTFDAKNRFYLVLIQAYFRHQYRKFMGEQRASVQCKCDFIRIELQTMEKSF